MYHFLREIDVLGVDEFGCIPAQLVTVMDIILRRLRRSPRFMGGVLLMPTMDAKQLYPIKGNHPMLSSHIITCFSFYRLEWSVRAARDPPLLRMQKITRMRQSELTEEIRQEFVALFVQHVGHIDKLTSPGVPPNATFVFAHLDNVKEPHSLVLYKGAVYQATFNYAGRFSQAQLVYLHEIPPQSTVNEMKPFDAYVAPPGCREAPPLDVTVQTLVEELGWKKVKVTKCPAHSRHVQRNTLARRIQYGLRLFTSATIHGVMGQTLNVLVSQVSDEDPLYSLWEREQVIVLLSRTRRARDMIFAGDKTQTANALFNALFKVSQFSEYIEHLLDRLIEYHPEHPRHSSHQQTPLTLRQHAIHYAQHPFRTKDAEIPSNCSGFAYILVSQAQPDVTYIGETQNLRERLTLHYQGSACSQTSIEHLRPWGMLAFVAGFEFSKSRRKSFESRWKALRDALRGSYSAQKVAELALQVMAERQRDYPEEKLSYVQSVI
ncbi:unknown protein [Seminavis robusta]|uniref:GIY-YIG domain-containing protein n=1 Tax=Seminavis robusta TaxID=568900 RepID=A0A9N8HF86_9STRA|nr:unknown protein [Seminavis robusta]|eukprot:Sro512_g157640.1 n/a (491) ;mRNA; f:33025-34637